MKKGLLKLGVFSISIICLFTGCNEGDTIYKATPDDNIATVDIKEFQISQINKIFISALPNDNTARYEFAIGKIEDRDKFESGELKAINIANGNSVDYTFENLTENTTYAVFARGYNDQDEAGPVSSIFAATTLDEMIMQISLQYVTNTSMAFEVDPGELQYNLIEYGYVTDLGELPDFENGSISNKRTAVRSSQMLVATFFDLEPDKQYYLVVRARDMFEEWHTFIEPIVTGSDPNMPNVNCEVLYSDFLKSTLKFSPTSNVSKFVVIHDPIGGSYNDLYDIMFLDKYINIEGDYLSYIEELQYDEYIATWNFTAEDEIDIYDRQMQEWRDNSVLVLIYDMNDTPASVVKLDWVSGSIHPGEGVAKVEIGISNITYQGARYTMTPNDATAGYFVETFTKYVLDGEAHPWNPVDYPADGIVKDDAWLINHFKTNIDRYYGQAATPGFRYMYTRPDSDEEFLLGSNMALERTAGPHLGGLELVVVALPMNKNGFNEGVGEITKKSYILEKAPGYTYPEDF